jgi:hypothetical protein
MERPTIQFRDGLQEGFARAYPSHTKEASGILSWLRWLEGCPFMLHGRVGASRSTSGASGISKMGVLRQREEGLAP